MVPKTADNSLSYQKIKCSDLFLKGKFVILSEGFFERRILLSATKILSLQGQARKQPLLRMTAYLAGEVATVAFLEDFGTMPNPTLDRNKSLVFPCFL